MAGSAPELTEDLGAGRAAFARHEWLDAIDAYWMAQTDEVMAEVELGLAHARLDRSLGNTP